MLEEMSRLLIHHRIVTGQRKWHIDQSRMQRCKKNSGVFRLFVSVTSWTHLIIFNPPKDSQVSEHWITWFCQHGRENELDLWICGSVSHRDRLHCSWRQAGAIDDPTHPLGKGNNRLQMNRMWRFWWWLASWDHRDCWWLKLGQPVKNYSASHDV